MRTYLLVATAAVLGALAAACSNDNYSYADVTMPVGDPAATINFAGSGSITVAEGSAVEAQITLMANNGDQLTGEIVSENANILEVLPVMDASAYVFMGISAGTTDVEVVVNGREVQTVTATVTALPASSMPATIDAATAGAGAAGPDA